MNRKLVLKSPALQESLTQEQADFIARMKDDELPHVKHFFGDKKFRRVTFAAFDCVPEKAKEEA